jgi:DNA-binding NarL/FixJ family response regulator
MIKKRIAIIEDEPIIALDFEKMIQEMDFESMGKFRNGQKALAEIKKNNPDLVLLDINLTGGISGYEIATELLAVKIPFLVITGSADAGSLKKISEMDANGVLIKPVYQAEFERTIKSILNKKPSTFNHSINTGEK